MPFQQGCRNRFSVGPYTQWRNSMSTSAFILKVRRSLSRFVITKGDSLMKPLRLLSLTVGLLLVCTCLASAEMLALLNYESKPDHPVRREGIAIMEIDPESSDFGKILMDIPLPADLVAHHIFFNRDRTKAYITALGKSLLHVIDLTRFPYRLREIPVPDCRVGEDLVVSEDNKTWYLTCMGSSNVIIGDAVKDRPIKTVSAAQPA